MSKMDKKTVIYGGDSEKISVNMVNWSKAEQAIQAACGEDVRIINLSDAKTTVAEARKGKHAAKTYVKIGLVGNDLVMRVKTPGTLMDTEVDTVLVKGAKAIIAQNRSEKKASSSQNNNNSSTTTVDKDVQEEAQEHLQLRAQMVDETARFREHTEGVLTELNTAQGSVEKFLGQIKQADSYQKKVLFSVVEQIVDGAREKIVAIQKEYRAFTRSGSPLMASRRDFAGVSKLPPEDQGDYKTKSGQLFRQASKTMEVVADHMTTVSYFSNAIQQGLELCEAEVGRVIDPIQALVRLGDIRSDLEPLKDGIERRFGKLEQVLDRQNSVWQTVLNGAEGIKPQRIKSFQGKVEEIEKLVSYLRGTQEPLKSFNRRLAAIPGEAMQDTEVSKAASEVRLTITGLRTMLKGVPALLTTWDQLQQDAKVALGLDD